MAISVIIMAAVLPGLSYAENLSRFGIEPGATVGDPLKSLRFLHIHPK